jgi:hypothetical protein
MKKGDLVEILIDSPFVGGLKGDIGQLYTIISHKSDPSLSRWVVLFGTEYHTLYDDEFKVVAS